MVIDAGGWVEIVPVVMIEIQMVTSGHKPWAFWGGGWIL